MSKQLGALETICALMFAFAVLADGGAHAQVEDDDFARCRRPESMAEARLTSCSNVIADMTRIGDVRAEAYLNRGIAHEELGQLAKAIEDYSEGLKLNPAYGYLYHRRGLAYGEEGKSDLAIADFTQAIRLDPKDVESRVYRGLLYAEQGEYGNAILDFDAALTENPNDPLVLAMRGEAREALGNHDSAIADFRRALELDAQNEVAKEGLARLGQRVDSK